jgi:hypothetical protein
MLPLINIIFKEQLGMATFQKISHNDVKGI